VPLCSSEIVIVFDVFNFPKGVKQRHVLGRPVRDWKRTKKIDLMLCNKLTLLIWAHRFSLCAWTHSAG
jgi:hypothetical protein